MAVITKSTALTGNWKEVTAALEMADGSSYAVEVQDDAETGQGHVIAVATNSNDAPGANVRGHNWYPCTAAGDGTKQTFPKKAGRFWWMKTTGPDFHAVATLI
ncbi:MAG: hypothetical protein OXG40_01070 [Acidimicrobiaceae bacterium]|nr:hypothetical protein [Acidimicrobiaceae bacterium]